MCDREGVFITYLIIIIKSKVSIFSIVVIFSVVVCLEWLFYRMLLLQGRFMMCGNNRVHYDPIVVFVCFHITVPHYHHYADVSEGTELLKCLSGTFCRVIKSILSVIFRAICILLIHFSYDDCENTCTLFYYHHQMESMTYLPLFR